MIRYTNNALSQSHFLQKANVLHARIHSILITITKNVIIVIMGWNFLKICITAPTNNRTTKLILKLRLI